MTARIVGIPLILPVSASLNLVLQELAQQRSDVCTWSISKKVSSGGLWISRKRAANPRRVRVLWLKGELPCVMLPCGPASGRAVVIAWYLPTKHSDVQKSAI
jgi:hypothetical protein